MSDKTIEFINKSKEVHGDKYDYSKVVYENNLKEVLIICKKHGEFLQLPKTHKRGSGCNSCGLLHLFSFKTPILYDNYIFINNGLKFNKLIY